MSFAYHSPDSKGGSASPRQGRPGGGFSAESVGGPSLVLRGALEKQAQVREARAREIGVINSAFNDTLIAILRDVGALKGHRIVHDMGVQGKLVSITEQAGKVRADLVSEFKGGGYSVRIPASITEFIKMADVMLEAETRYFLEMKGTAERLTGALTATTQNEAKLIAVLTIKKDGEVERLEKQLERLEGRLGKMKEPELVLSPVRTQAVVRKVEKQAQKKVVTGDGLVEDLIKTLRAATDDVAEAQIRYSERMQRYREERDALTTAINNKRAEISAAELGALEPCEEEGDRLARLKKREGIKFDSAALTAARDAAEKVLGRARGYVTWLRENTSDKRGLRIVNRDNAGKITAPLDKIINALGKISGKQGAGNTGVPTPEGGKKQGESAGPFEALYSAIVGNAKKLEERLGKGKEREETEGTDTYESQAAMACENQRAEIIRMSLRKDNGAT